MSEREPNFEQEFERTQPEREINRMDALHPTEGLPEYVGFVRELREDLRGFVESEGWPEYPETIESVDDLFAVGRAVVAEYWKRSAGPKLAERCKGWAKQVKGKTGRAAREFLLNPDKLEEGLRIQQIGVLETIRKAQPEAWRALVMVSSERQLAVLALVRHWVKKDDKEPRDQEKQDKTRLSNVQIEKMGVGRDELELLVDAAGILGKYIDHAYVKQIEITDLPGGMERTPLDIEYEKETKGEEEERGGAEYLYDYYKESAVITKTYSEVFPFEWPKIVSRLQALSKRVGRLLSGGKLPNSYQGLPAYLEQVATMYGSEIVDPKTLEDSWQDLYDRGAELAEKGCPLMLIAQGDASVAGEADKVDVELRFGLQTRESRRAVGSFEKLCKIARALNKQYRDSLEELPPTQKIVLNIQPLAFGPNLIWMSQAETSETKVVAHMNPVVDAAVMKELPLLEKLKMAGESDGEWYRAAALLETVLHELGHTVMPTEDDRVDKRIGSHEALDELKADTIGMLLMARGMVLHPSLRKIAERQLIAKIGTIANYLTGKSSVAHSAGEPYYLAGAAQLVALLESGALAESEGRYVVTDARAGIEALAELGDSVLQRFYVDKASTPKKVAKYFAELRKLKEDPRLKRFVEVLRD